MNVTLPRRLITGFAILVAVLWTLGMGLVYALLGATDDVLRWVNGFVPLAPELAHGLQTAGTWLAQFGSWLLIVIWAIGLVLVLLLSMIARRFTNLLRNFQHEARMS